LIPAIMAVLLGVLSAAVTVLMCRETNKRLISDPPEDIDSQKPGLYKKNPLTVAALAGIVLASAAVGYLSACGTDLWIALFEIFVCYLAVLAAAVIDLKTQTIPNWIPLALMGARLLIFLYEVIFTDAAVSYMISSLVGGLLCGLLLVISNKLSKGGIGGGDIKLLAAMGFLRGLSVTFATLLLSLIACSVISVFLLLSKKCTMKDHVPFGPFVYLGHLAVCLMTLY